MTLPENILGRIPGENPSGQNLRWDPLYEKVKEARREEDDLPQGEWVYKVKTADPALVIRLTSEALSTRTKDLQLAAWLTEALLLQNGVAGLRAGLELLCGMIQNFWDTLYPEVEDGDVELRAAPLSWVGSSLADQVKKIPLTRSHYDWLKYLESRAVGYEEACQGNETRMKARETAIAEKKLSPEAFDRDAELTPRDFYADLANELDLSLQALQALGDLCDQKLKGDRPSFSSLRTAVEDLQSFVAKFVKKEEEPAPEQPAQHAVDPIPESTIVEHFPEKREVALRDPVDRADAVSRIEAAANCLRRMDPSNPASYMVLRGLRWAELFTKQSSDAAADLDPPASETRQQLKRLAKAGEWRDLLEASEAALASGRGAAWLDLQRYSAQACRELGRDYDPVFAAIRSSLSALMTEFSDLPKAEFADETSVASAETRAWLEENLISPRPNGAEVDGASLQQVPSSSGVEAQVPDARELAMKAVRSGRVQEAMEILTREIAQERSGRKRFERKAQLAQVCLTAGQESIAYPILKDLAQEIECRKLEDWESPAVLANPLTLLFRCMEKMGVDAREKQEIYERICRLDPIQALSCLK